jgi:hypothetical protein
VPYVFALSVSRELVGGDRARTAFGHLRQDITGAVVKREWRIETRPMTKSEADAIIDELDDADWGPVDFWIDEFGSPGETIEAFVVLDAEERVTFGRNGVFHNDGRQLMFTVTEV